MSMEITNNYNNYAANYVSMVTKESESKTYSNTKEYKNYLTEKYDCLTSKDYSVAINSSFLREAAGDEKKAKWLEYNLSLIPKIVDKTKAMVQARGSQIISYNITINGYDSMSAELCTKAEADPGTEKAREELKERIEKKREEKKAEEKKKEEKAAEEARKETSDYVVSTMGTDIKVVSQNIIKAVSDSTVVPTTSFDLKA